MQRIIPVVRVSSMVRSRDFYEKLGFKLDFVGYGAPDGGDPVYFGVRRGQDCLHLSSHAGDSAFGCAINLQIGDVDQLHTDFVREGVAIHIAPVDQTWGMREMSVKDPDGNSLTFRQPVR